MSTLNGSIEAYASALPSQYVTTYQDPATLDVPGRNFTVYLNSTTGPVVSYAADGSAPSNYGFHTLIRIEGYLRNAANTADTFRITTGPAGGNNPVTFAQGGIVSTALTQDAPTPGGDDGGDPGNGGGDVS
jgi:hypothetical protein